MLIYKLVLLSFLALLPSLPAQSRFVRSRFIIKNNRPLRKCPIFRFPTGYRRVCPTDDMPDNIVQSTTEYCGLSKPELRIVGGRRAELNEYPWQVSIELIDGDGYFHTGGGVIIDRRWILTAAHVIADLNFTALRGRVGISDLDEPGTILTFDRSVTHKDYNGLKNDIALLHTTSNIDLYPKTVVQNVPCFPVPNQEFTGNATVTGWGTRDNEGSRNSTLQSVSIFLLNPTVCEKAFRIKNFDRKIMVCAGDTRGGADSCKGDSGGPLIQWAGDRAYLVGLVSFGLKNACGFRGIGAAYTKVSSYIDWIKDNMN